MARPAGRKDTDKTPVILSIGPYFNHSGQTGPAGPVENTPFDPIQGGPSDRFYDYINGALISVRAMNAAVAAFASPLASTGRPEVK